MAILGTILFALFFLLIAPKSREFLGGMVGGAGDWIVKWAPYSYLLLVLLVLVPLIAAVVVLKWPQPPQPEDPLAKYKAAQDVID